MPSERAPTGCARVALALLLVAAGTPVILAAFDVGPFHRADLHGPPWLATTFGGVFVLAGVAMLAGNRRPSPAVAFALTFVILACFAAVPTWVAFGPGPRTCSSGFSMFMFGSARVAAEFECRAAFGVAAVILNGMLICMLAGAPKRFLGAGPATNALDTLGAGALLVGLLPVLLPALLFGAATGLVRAVRGFLTQARVSPAEASRSGGGNSHSS